MCGIWFSLHNREFDDEQIREPPDDLMDFLDKRGPDWHAILGFVMAEFKLSFFCSVLPLRGSGVTRQSIHAGNLDSGCLAWNGEAWRMAGDPIAGNDVEQICEYLQVNASHAVPAYLDLYGRAPVGVKDPVLRMLALVDGPFAFVYHDPHSFKLYFGRDHLGRRSLLMKREASSNSFIISSVSDGTPGWVEVPSDGVHVVNLVGVASDPSENKLRVRNVNVDLPAMTTHVPWSSLRVLPKLSRCAKPGTDIDNGPPRIAVDSLEGLLRISTRLRVSNIPNLDLPRNSLHGLGSHRQAVLAVLFSGGLDCTVLARMAHDILPAGEPIDLLNVAFENPHIHDRMQLLAEGKTPYDVCPDRVTAHSSLSELQSVCPGREFRLIEIDVHYSETLEHRPTVMKLMYPHNTEMDLSISLALYFAARGIGTWVQPTGDKRQQYQTSARVLLSGLGADELFAGYQRHATAYTHRGDPGLLEELELDYSRLGQRNLGRDDRVISHWGKEVRYPYLDEDVVRWAVEAPLSHKCGFGLDMEEHVSGIADPTKLVLRLVAQMLGLPGVAKEKKRAIQFGARTAKMQGKTTGTAVIQSSLDQSNEVG